MQLTDIEKEMRYYRPFFKGKTVFCNCDDPYESNFFKYFAVNFNSLGLRLAMPLRPWRAKNLNIMLIPTGIILNGAGGI